MIKTGNFDIKLNISYEMKSRRKWVLIYCPRLDIYTQGLDEEEAIDNLRDALVLFFMGAKVEGEARLAWEESDV